MARIVWHGDEFLRKVKRGVERALDQTRFRMEARIKSSFGSSPSSPGDPPGVKTGQLRSSITSSREGLKAKIGSTIAPRGGQSQSYAFYQERGTSKMRARPYLRPALDAEAPRLVRDLERNV